jgi:ElaB/YqjD/DUF883 family membrane-anchored ribosome-binding protein
MPRSATPRDEVELPAPPAQEHELLSRSATFTGETCTMEPTNPRATAHETIDRVAETATAYAERFGEKAEEWLEMKDNWVEGAREYVREHPIAALGIAAAAGYVLSMLMRSRD